tara:strand:- start:83 stop:823 length:741 start_codon:yes stop_codon:yes gene_type:complete
MLTRYVTAFAAGLTLVAASMSVHADGHGHSMSHTDIAKAWMSAGQNGGKEASLKMLKEHMAEDGVVFRPRYVGLGFTHDGYQTGSMIVNEVIEGSPADGTLEVGDQFISVKGVAVTADNMDRLSFRGKPGEKIDAVIKRGDKEMPISLARGKISYTISKADMVEWMEGADGDDWGDEKFTLHEAVGDGNVVYVWTEIMNTDDTTGLPVETHVVTRFLFNDDGKVAAIANLREDRFMLEQSGFSITR